MKIKLCENGHKYYAEVCSRCVKIDTHIRKVRDILGDTSATKIEYQNHTEGMVWDLPDVPLYLLKTRRG